MRLTVIIPTKNRMRDLMVALRAVAAQTRRPEEIVLVDQSDEAPDPAIRGELERAFGGLTEIRWMHDASIAGLVAAKRVGVIHSTGDAICFLEDDVVPEPEFLERLAATLMGDAGVIGCCGIVTDAPFGWLYAAFHAVFHRGIFRDRRPWIFVACRHRPGPRVLVDTISGGLSMWRREVFRRVPFDTVNGFHMLEDVDFSTRVARCLRGRVAIVPGARLEHRFAAAGRASIGQRERRKVVEYFQFLRTRPHSPLDAACLAWVILGSGLSAFAAAFRHRSVQPMVGIARGVIDGFGRRAEPLGSPALELEAMGESGSFRG